MIRAPGSAAGGDPRGLLLAGMHQTIGKRLSDALFIGLDLNGRSDSKTNEQPPLECGERTAARTTP